jgi:hypothetical protein
MNEHERAAVLDAIDVALQLYRTDLTAITTVKHLRSARAELDPGRATAFVLWPSLRELPELSDEQIRALATVSETRLGQDLAVAAGVAWELHCGLVDAAARSAYVDERTLEFLTDHARAFRERYERFVGLLDEVDPVETHERQEASPPRSAPQPRKPAAAASGGPPMSPRAPARADSAREAARLARAGQRQPASAATRGQRTPRQLTGVPQDAAARTTAAARRRG